MSLEFCGLRLPHHLFLAPMAGITTRPFRTIALSLGAALAWTEMVSAEGLVRKDRRTKAYLPTGGEGGPVAVQLFGHRPETLRDAALIVEQCPGEIIDINMGCPVRKVVREGSGAALMRNPRQAARILEAVCGAVSKPVTVKMRSGWNERSRNAVELARIAQESGAAAVIVHGRTARQGFSGTADWDIVAEVAAALKIPVVGSGDLDTPAKVRAVFRRSACEAVMIGRGALGRPWIFREILEAPPDGTGVGAGPEEIGRIMLLHLELNLEEFGEKKGVVLSRRPLAWYSRGLPGAGEFRRRINALERSEEMRREISVFVSVARDGRGLNPGGAEPS